MDKVDWSKAPEWADRALLNCNDDWLFSDGVRFITTAGSTEYHDSSAGNGGRWLGVDDFKAVKMRPDNWKEGEKRMEPIGQNGNEGEHYAELDNVNHPEHYQSDNGVECIDAIRAALGREGFIAYCRGNAIEYNWRSGSKANHAEDLKKGAWYSNRAAEELGDDK